MNQMEQVRDAMQNGCTNYAQIAKYTGLSQPRVKSAMANARTRGIIEMSNGKRMVAEPKRTLAVWAGPVLSEWRPYPFKAERSRP